MKHFIEAHYPLVTEEAMKEGKSDKLYIKIEQPQRDELSRHGDYFCSYELKAPELELQSKTFGIDGLQALWLALRLIQSVVKNYEKKNNVTCEYFFDIEGGSGFGFEKLT